MEATKRGTKWDAVVARDITKEEVEAYAKKIETAGDKDTKKLFGIAAGHVVFKESIRDVVEDGDSLQTVGVIGTQKVGKSTLLNALFNVGARCGECLYKQTTTGIQVYVKEERVILDCEGANSVNAEENVTNKVEREHKHLAKTYQANLQAALMSIVVAMCNPVIFVFSDPGNTQVFDMLMEALRKLKLEDNGKRRLILAFNKANTASRDDDNPVFRKFKEDEDVKEFFGSIEGVVIPVLTDEAAWELGIEKLRTCIGQSTSSTKTHDILELMSKVTDQVNTATGTMCLDYGAMIKKIEKIRSDKKVCKTAIDEQKAKFSTTFPPEAVAEKQEIDQFFEDARVVVEDELKSYGVPPSMIKTYVDEFSTFLNNEFNNRLSCCQALCSCRKKSKCTLGNVKHTDANKGIHQCGELLQCYVCGELKCKDEEKCTHCQQACAKHGGHCELERQHKADCKFSCRDTKKCTTCGALTDGTRQCENRPFVCDCCKRGGHSWRGHQHQKVHARASSIPLLGFVENAHWQCAVRRCGFHGGYFRWDTIVKDERSGTGCTSKCGVCGVYRVHGKLVDHVIQFHGN